MAKVTDLSYYGPRAKDRRYLILAKLLDKSIYRTYSIGIHIYNL